MEDFILVSNFFELVVHISKCLFWILSLEYRVTILFRFIVEFGGRMFIRLRP